MVIVKSIFGVRLYPQATQRELTGQKGGKGTTTAAAAPYPGRRTLYMGRFSVIYEIEQKAQNTQIPGSVVNTQIGTLTKRAKEVNNEKTYNSFATLF